MKNKQGNERVLATPGKGQSFKAKMSAEELKLRYPNEKVVIINPKDEFEKLFKEGK